MIIVNMVFQLQTLWMPFNRFGVDTTAYIIQAGQFMSGQNNYEYI